MPFLSRLAAAMALVIILGILGLQGPVIIGRVVDLVETETATYDRLHTLIVLYVGLQVAIAVLCGTSRRISCPGQASTCSTP